MTKTIVSKQSNGHLITRSGQSVFIPNKELGQFLIDLINQGDEFLANWISVECQHFINLSRNKDDATLGD